MYNVIFLATLCNIAFIVGVTDAQDGKKINISQFRKYRLNEYKSRKVRNLSIKKAL